MAHGGTRPGAGRKAKSETYASPIAALERQIADALPRLIANLLILADGVLVQTVDAETGGVETFTKPPDRRANEYLINRIAGTPTARQEISGTDGGPIVVRRAEDLSDDELAAIIARCSPGADSA